MTRTLVWVSALSGPAPQLCDDEAMLTTRKYQRVLAEHQCDEDGWSLYALAMRYPAPPIVND